VTSFFVLSGFLIVFILTRLSKARKERYMSWTTAMEFLFRRYFRLAPSIFVSTIIVMVYSYYAGLSDHLVWSHFWIPCKTYWWQNIIFLNNLSTMLGETNCYDSVWTISVEMQLVSVGVFQNFLSQGLFSHHDFI
jgi:peptidoglycan/LPS O-acetylase OafA/YrhL